MKGKFTILFVFSLPILTVAFLIFPKPVNALSLTPTPIPTSPPERIAPKNIRIEQLHKNYTDNKHRYRLTIEGDSLDERKISKNYSYKATFRWSTNCGKFYEGGKGPSTKYHSYTNRTVIWGYEFPKEDCTEAKIAVDVYGYNGGERVDQVILEQKIFYPEVPPQIDAIYYKGITPLQPMSLDRKIKMFIGNMFRLLFGGPPDDPTKTEVPGGVTSVRG